MYQATILLLFVRYRCYIGRAYLETDLNLKQYEQLEPILWVALRMMEEKRQLLLKTSTEETFKGLKLLAFGHSTRAAELRTHIENLKTLMYSINKN